MMYIYRLSSNHGGCPAQPLPGRSGHNYLLHQGAKQDLHAPLPGRHVPVPCFGGYPQTGDRRRRYPGPTKGWRRFPKCHSASSPTLAASAYQASPQSGQLTAHYSAHQSGGGPGGDPVLSGGPLHLGEPQNQQPGPVELLLQSAAGPPQVRARGRRFRGARGSGLHAEEQQITPGVQSCYLNPPYSPEDHG